MEGGNNLTPLSILDKADSTGLEFMTQQFVNRHWNRGQGKWDFHRGVAGWAYGLSSLLLQVVYVFMCVYTHTPDTVLG